MNGRTLARIAAAATSLGIGAVLTFTATATAEPAPKPLDVGLTKLGEIAEKDPAALPGVTALNQYTKLVDVAGLLNIGSLWTPFAYAAPTFGCGSNGPITTIIAAATTLGPAKDEGAPPTPGTLRFSATPAHSGAPLASGLVVAWVNLNNGASGVDTLDDLTEYGMPSLSKTVNSGPGMVLASMWGIIDYPFAHCVMTPTVGTFMVPDAPPPPPVAPAAPAVPPPAAAPSPGSGEVAPGAPAAPVPANAPAAPTPAPAPAPAPAAPTAPKPPAANSVHN
ncbi:hypothetical protein [Nocardia sp. NPDC052566]|uniref:hypothetical protein n=1 Tax=Nocardia sp. NPDC052566 TaxID=3364330 RepID=UPI0037C6FD80